MAPRIQGLRMGSVDPTSYSEPEKCVTTHLDWDVKLDFQKEIIYGHAKFDFEKKSTDLAQVLLDVRDLDVQAVSLEGSNEALQYHVDNPANVLIGSRLAINLPSSLQGDRFSLKVQYATTPESSALQWLRPEHTNGKRQPYLYSQCQAVHARSLLPCQDCPAVKFTYTAKVEAPKEITVLMSASRNSPQAAGDNLNVTSFEMKVPIPSYLVAIVAGDIESRNIGPRSKVWAEKEVVDKAAAEFSETEAMLKTAEDIAGPYVWGHYDLLVLPACFPYGGMENPCLTFVTPTLLAGDKSLVDVVAHEISHSWTGNLVTNASNEHFWLNEGHTMFLERKILSRLHGEAHRQVHAHEGWEGLSTTVRKLNEKGKEVFTRLVPDLVGVDPDEAFSRIPYEKGFSLLAYVENLMGGPERFNPFLKSYLEHFKYKSITSQDWKDYLYQYFKSDEDQHNLSTVDWDAWFHGMGMPPYTPSYDLSSVQPSIDLANRWVSQPDGDLQVFSPDDLQGLPSSGVRFFVTHLLLSEAPISQAKVQHMEKLYHFNQIRNSEIRVKWQQLCIKAQWADIVPHVLEFVNEQGRMKFVEPLYSDMYKWEDVGRAPAIINFKEQRSEMHPTTAKKVAEILHLQE